MRLIHSIFFIPLILGSSFVLAQISPGDLAQAHAHLEGMSNCTKCHLLGEKVSNEKCLDCHTLLKARIDQNKGYHVSAEIRGKECVECHSDHHGRKFEMIRFDVKAFNHELTGYELQGSHVGKECRDCHQNANITDPKVREKEYTFLGLDQACLSCHEDFHQQTLSSDCASCHDFDKFRPAPLFDHNNTDYPLQGKHRETDCIKCHKKEIKNGKDFQQFSGIPFQNCTSCHTDVHNNRFGQNCVQCHTVESFTQIREINRFNHNQTAYPLEGKHQFVDCKSCHKSRLIDPLRYNYCSDCHSDYHENQFYDPNRRTDCSDCHTTKGFQQSSFTIEQHNQASFPLNGAHLATPCFVCHKKSEKWSFRNIDNRCVDCHQDIHDPYLDKKYYPQADCRSCHDETRWSYITFDHQQTNFELVGVHEEQTCRSCHFNEQEPETYTQQFAGLGENCTSCHTDNHYGQFEKNGQTVCTDCHDSYSWAASRFDHNKTQFALDGAHESVACNECHKPIETEQANYTLYKIDDFRCEACHK